MTRWKDAAVAVTRALGQGTQTLRATAAERVEQELTKFARHLKDLMPELDASVAAEHGPTVVLTVTYENRIWCWVCEKPTHESITWYRTPRKRLRADRTRANTLQVELSHTNFDDFSEAIQDSIIAVFQQRGQRHESPSTIQLKSLGANLEAYAQSLSKHPQVTATSGMVSQIPRYFRATVQAPIAFLDVQVRVGLVKQDRTWFFFVLPAEQSEGIKLAWHPNTMQRVMSKEPSPHVPRYHVLSGAQIDSALMDSVNQFLVAKEVFVSPAAG